MRPFLFYRLLPSGLYSIIEYKVLEKTMNKHLDTIDSAIARLHSDWWNGRITKQEYDQELLNLCALHAFVEDMLELE